MKVLAKSRYELYASFPIFLIGFILTAHYPQGFYDFLILAGSRVLALFCVTNALLDINRMRLFERAITIPWFLVLVYLALTGVLEAASIRTFADR